MNRKRSRGEQGLTLLEILLALIVLVIGIVGILALFPTALESAKESMEYSQAAITGESVANALAVACRLATLDPATGSWSAILSHDLKMGDSNARTYKFPLPKLTDMGNSREGTNWVHHPGAQPAAKIAEDQAAFEMGSDQWTAAILEEVRKTDPNDPLAQFAFSFRIRKVHTLAWLEGKMKPDGKPYTMEDLDPISKLYEFQIFIFRLLGGAEDGKGQPKRLIAVLTTRVSTK